jgi:uncharacterized protein
LAFETITIVLDTLGLGAPEFGRLGFGSLGFGAALALGGFLVGGLVGLTGVGGGSLMTPLLILVFGIKPQLAIGTDLLFAAFTKAGALPNLVRQQRIDWAIVGWLGLGSVSASLLTMRYLETQRENVESIQSLSCHLLGLALVLTAASMLYKAARSRAEVQTAEPVVQSIKQLSLPKALACLLLGLGLGALVSLTSVGAGAIGTAVLIALFPRLPLIRIVGNDIAHAIPLTLVAGLGHAWLGSVNWPMLGCLLLGSLPGVWLGSHRPKAIPERWLRGGLSLLLGYAGVRLVMF